MRPINEFKKLFSDSIDTDEHGEILESVFQLLRTMYISGWNDAIESGTMEKITDGS